MGLSPYSTPADAGVLCVILVNTAISISIVKEIVRSILNVIGIHIAPCEEYSMEGPLDTFECRGTPSESYMEEFRSQTPAIRYDSVCIPRHPEKECSVCLTDFAPDAEINRLPCGHVFHRLCLEKWLRCWSVTCPLCRNCMVPHEGDEDTCPITNSTRTQQSCPNRLKPEQILQP
nr:probable E3 ubiquitin-protein ligase XERICO [Ipomoea batatas]